MAKKINTCYITLRTLIVSAYSYHRTNLTYIGPNTGFVLSQCNLIKISSTHLLPPFFFVTATKKKGGSKCIELILIRLKSMGPIELSTLSALGCSSIHNNCRFYRKQQLGPTPPKTGPDHIYIYWEMFLKKSYMRPLNKLTANFT